MEKKNIDWSNLGFGYVPTDKRFVANFKNGSWDYFSGKMKIAYDSQENIYSLSLTTRSETKLNELSLVKLFPRIKKRI